MTAPRNPEADERDRRDEEVERASQESFPASDPPSWTPDHPGPPDRHGKDRDDESDDHPSRR